MKIIKPSVKIMNPPKYEDMLRHIEAAGRTCYKSEDRIDEGSADKFIQQIVSNNHLSVLEHSSLSARFITDRGVSHELVRHRLCSFSQESQRYCNYSGEKFGSEATFIEPLWYSENVSKISIDERRICAYWRSAMQSAESAYSALLKMGKSPQEARSVLPNSTKTEIVVTANLREWRLIFSQRCDKAAHPEMRRAMLPLLEWCINEYPVFFKDLDYTLCEGKHDFKAKGWELTEAEVE
jgi:thymidylate synthase (FAD)